MIAYDTEYGTGAFNADLVRTPKYVQCRVVPSMSLVHTIPDKTRRQKWLRTAVLTAYAAVTGFWDWGRERAVAAQPVNELPPHSS